MGERHIFVRLSGCSLGCEYCDTSYSLGEADLAYVEEGAGKPSSPLRNPLSSRAVMEAVLAQEIFPGFNSKLSITGGEPLEQPEFLRGLLEELEGRFEVLLETNGILADALREIVDFIDIISMDFKIPSTTGKGEFWEKHRDFLDAAKSKELVAKVVVSSGTRTEEVETAAKMLATTAPEALLVIQPVALAAKSGPSPEMLFEFYSCARQALKKVRVIPQVHKILGVR
ncbi:MAG: 7-carboxy-7-deazaguanine synthase QueE [Nitrospirota bacterium]